MTPAINLSLRALKRDWRAGELRLMTIAIVIAVASLTSVGFFTDRVRRATELHATELLAADLVLLSGRPLTQDAIDAAHQAGLVTTRTTSFRSVVIAGEQLQMAEVKAIEKGYPIRGTLRISNSLFGKEIVTDEIPAPGTVWVDARLLQSLGMGIGAQINLGATTFTVTRLLTYEPDRGGDLFNIAPRLLMNRADLAATRLILPGSRVQYRLLAGGKVNAVAAYRHRIENKSDDNLKILGIRDARPELKSALQRAEQFLGLAALVSIALGGLAVAMSAQRYAVRHFDYCAMLRCLGAGQRHITRIYLIQLLVLSIGSSLLGCVMGYAAQEGLTSLMPGLSGDSIPAPSLRPVWTGFATGIVTTLGFAMPQILRLRSVPPLRVLRRELAPLPVSAIGTYLIAVLTLALLTPWQSGNLRLTLYTFLGILLTAVILAGCAHVMIRWLNRLRSRVGVAYRYGLANIARRKNRSIAQILGIGLGVMILLLLTLIRTDLLENWKNRLPEGTPNYFLINIQPDEVKPLQAFLQRHAALAADIYPMIRGRLIAINGQAVDPDHYRDQRAKRLANREFNLSWAEALQSDNRLVAGKWWSGVKTDRVMFSVEQGVAKTLGFDMDDALTFSIGGREVTGKVTNVRRVDWDTFNVNFFVIANPGSLDDYPGTYITSFYLPPHKRDRLIGLVKRFPSTTVIDVDALLGQVRAIMRQVIKTVEFVSGFTLLAGLVVMLAALQTTYDERRQESALLSALGANRRQLLSGLIAEFICLGLVAGLLSAFCATVVELILAEFVFKMEIIINPWIWLIAPLLCTLVIVLGGLAGTWKVLYTPPIESLRQV